MNEFTNMLLKEIRYILHMTPYIHKCIYIYINIYVYIYSITMGKIDLW